MSGRARAAAIAAVVILAAAWLIFGRGEAAPETGSVHREDLALTVEAAGEIDAVRSSLIGPPFVPDKWDFKISWLVPESTTVRKGDPVVSFDTTSLEDERQKKQLEYEVAVKDLEKREARRAEAETKDALVKAALAKNEFEVPPAMVERAIDGMIEGAAERFARSGIDIRQLQLDYARMRADLREQALLQVRGRLLLEAIADAEKIEVTEEDVQAEVARLADEVGTPLAKLQQQMRGKDAREALKNKVREDKALALLSSSATIKNV